MLPRSDSVACLFSCATCYLQRPTSAYPAPSDRRLDPRSQRNLFMCKSQLSSEWQRVRGALYSPLCPSYASTRPAKLPVNSDKGRRWRALHRPVTLPPQALCRKTSHKEKARRLSPAVPLLACLPLIKISWSSLHEPRQPVGPRVVRCSVCKYLRNKLLSGHALLISY